MDEEIIDTTQQPTTQPADNGNKGSERMFTQSEVDKIVRERLARERAKAAPQEPTEAELIEKEFSAREKALAAMESRFACQAYLANMGYCMEIMDVLDTSDLMKFKSNATTVQNLVDHLVRETLETGNFRYCQIPEPTKSSELGVTFGTVDGFKNTKHIPRQYFAYDD